MKVNSVDTNSNSKIKTVAKAAVLATAVGVSIAAGKRLKGVDIDTFVKKGGFIEDGAVKIKTKSGKIKNYTGKIVSTWKDGWDKSVHTFEVKKGEIKKFVFTAREKVEEMPDKGVGFFKLNRKLVSAKQGDAFKVSEYDKQISKLGDNITKEIKKDADKVVDSDKIQTIETMMYDTFGSLLAEATK